METKEMKLGDIVQFKFDIRGFLATYIIVEIDGENALLGRNHLWKTDWYVGKWQPISKLEISKQTNMNIKDNLK